MKKKIAISLRIDHHRNINEYRNSIDIRLVDWVISLGFQPFLIPNHYNFNPDDYLKIIKPDALILSGGNDLGEFDFRDDVENKLINFFLDKNKKIYGICRGMQMIGNFFKIKLKKNIDHLKTFHQVEGFFNFKVNSFHAYELVKIPKNFKLLAKCKKTCAIEAIISNNNLILGTMWHPERPKENKEFNNFFKDFILNQNNT